MTDKEKIDFISHWSTWFYDYTDTYNGALGRQLAYLWPAVVNGNQIEVTSNSAIVKVLKRGNVGPCETIWQFIDIV